MLQWLHQVRFQDLECLHILECHLACEIYSHDKWKCDCLIITHNSADTQTNHNHSIVIYIVLHCIDIYIMPQYYFVGSDFTTASFNITIPPNEDVSEPSEIVIPQMFNVTDDNIDEVVQSFVLVAEISKDVPDSFACFQREQGETGCNANMEPTARFGATKISINDDDGRFNVHCLVQFVRLLRYNIAVMIIGFTQRGQNVSEADVPNVTDFQIIVNVMSFIVSEINYNVIFETPNRRGIGVPDVGDLKSSIRGHDALFGTFNETVDDFQEIHLLSNGSLSTSFIVKIINDFTPEPVECFTINIVSPDVAGDRDIYECYDDHDNMNMFFCLHKICIEDDDGLFIDFG